MEETLCEWEGCKKPFVPKKRGQRFHTARCRAAWHKGHCRADGIVGTAVSVRLLKGGKTSMVIHFSAGERMRLASFSQGQKVKVND